MSNDELERAQRIIQSFVLFANEPPEDQECRILDEIVESGEVWLMEYAQAHRPMKRPRALRSTSPI